MAQTADGAILAAGLQAKNAQSLGNDDLLLLVVGRGDTLEDLEALESGGTPGSLVRDHATDGLVEDSGGSAEVEGTCELLTGCLRWKAVGIELTTAGGVVSGHLAQVGVVLDCFTISGLLFGRI